MITVFKRTLKDRWVVFIIYIIAATAFMFMHTSIFPSIKDQQVDIGKMLESMPKGFTEAFGLQDYDMSKFENYISGEEFSLIWPLLLLIMSISFAGNAIAGEIERGTIEILLSQPVSRTKLYLAKYFSGILFIVSFIVLTISLLILIASIFGISVKIANFLSLSLIAFFFALAMYSVAMFLTSIFSDRGKVYFISAGILFAMYALNIISGLKENLKDLKYFSFFHYYIPNDLLIRNHIDTQSIVVFSSVALLFSIAGIIAFNKRDISA